MAQSMIMLLGGCGVLVGVALSWYARFRFIANDPADSPSPDSAGGHFLLDDYSGPRASRSSSLLASSAWAAHYSWRSRV